MSKRHINKAQRTQQKQQQNTKENKTSIDHGCIVISYIQYIVKRTYVCHNVPTIMLMHHNYIHFCIVIVAVEVVVRVFHSILLQIFLDVAKWLNCCHIALESYLVDSSAVFFFTFYSCFFVVFDVASWRSFVECISVHRIRILNSMTFVCV